MLGDICAAVGAGRALDLFTGTTRVAQEFKRRGAETVALDSARYAYEFARCYVALDERRADRGALEAALADLARRPGIDGYVTETFCTRSRFFQPHNGRRIDAIRDAIEHDYSGSWMYPVLLTSLIEAADRVDSTTGVQMAYVKQWAARSNNELAAPDPGAGRGKRPGRARRCVGARRSPRPVRSRVHRPAVQPAPVLHELPHLGDAHCLGRARALRRRLQARGRARRRDEEPVQRTAAHARCAGTRDCRRGRAPRRHLVQRRGLGDDRGPGGDGRGAGRGSADARVRLEALRRRPDRHTQPAR